MALNSERFSLALPPELKKKFFDRARKMSLDPPALARIAFAVVAERGVKFDDPTTPGIEATDGRQ